LAAAFLGPVAFFAGAFLAAAFLGAAAFFAGAFFAAVFFLAGAFLALELAVFRLAILIISLST